MEGITVHADGYRMVRTPRKPSGGKRYTFEHVLVAENALGKPLPDGAVVHHVNGIRQDNRNGNLVICQDRNYHRLLHMRTDAVKAGHPPTWRKCKFCKTYADPDLLTNYSSKSAYHKACFNTWQKNRRDRMKLDKEVK